MSLREVLESYKHIELTDDEFCEAMINAKRIKEEKIKRKEREKRAEETRKKYTTTMWNYKQTYAYALFRANELFSGKFIIDEHNEPVFNLLCHYFSDSAEFIDIAKKLGIDNPSLEKGLFLCGNFGVGKSWLMSLFRKNNKRVFHVVEAKAVAKQYKINGNEAIEKYNTIIKNALDDPSVFYQQYSALCIEDIGAEDVKGNFGDKCNVVGDIIEERYAKGCLKGWFHGTTNLTTEQLKEYYGGRAISRLRECVNLIELSGPDRRK
jgi:DNA replication protein DnaC